MGPFSLQAPTVDELLLWHSQYGIRFIDIAVERSAQWLMALAGLNLALRRYGETGWSFKHVVGAEINASRRTLFHVPRDAITPCAVEPGKRRLRQAFSAFSECVPKSVRKSAGCAAPAGEAARKMLSSLTTIP